MGSRNLEVYNGLRAKAGFEHDNTSDRLRSAVLEIIAPDYECVEPPSLPHGGVHKGADAWVRMNKTMGELWDQQVQPLHVWDIPEHDIIILHSLMTWTSRETGKKAVFPAVEILHFVDARLSKVEVFLQDTKQILETLQPVS